jgi:hypothetical protein
MARGHGKDIIHPFVSAIHKRLDTQEKLNRTILKTLPTSQTIFNKEKI